MEGDHQYQPGTIVAAGGGYYPDGRSKPIKIGMIVDAGKGKLWPRVRWSDNGKTETVTPSALTVIDLL